MLQEARPVDPYFLRIGSISSWKTETVQTQMNKNQLYQPQPHSTLKSDLNKKMGSQRRLPQHKRVHTMRVKNHHNLNIILGWIRMGSPIESVLLYNWLQSAIGIRDQRERNTQLITWLGIFFIFWIQIKINVLCDK